MSDEAAGPRGPAASSLGLSYFALIVIGIRKVVDSPVESVATMVSEYLPVTGAEVHFEGLKAGGGLACAFD